MEAEFRQIFSDAFGCPPAEFEERMFAKCLFRHAWLFTWFIGDKRKFFREDLEMLREMATARNTQEVISELNRFYGRNRRDRNFLRTKLFVRVSGKRVLLMYRSLPVEKARDSSLEGATLQPQH